MLIQTIFILNILINLCFLVAIWKIKNQKKETIREIVLKPIASKKIEGKLEKMYVRSVIAEKMAERSFNLASSANLGVIALQKALQTPRIMNRNQSLKNQVAKDDIDKLFTSSGTFDYLRPILSEEELDVLDNIEKEQFQNGESV